MAAIVEIPGRHIPDPAFIASLNTPNPVPVCNPPAVEIVTIPSPSPCVPAILIARATNIVGTANYEWSNGATGPTTVGHGTFFVKVTDSNNNVGWAKCTEELSKNDINIDFIKECASADTANDGILRVQLSGGAGATSGNPWLWELQDYASFSTSPSLSNSSPSGIFDINGIAPGDYVLWVSDGAGCRRRMLISMCACPNTRSSGRNFDVDAVDTKCPDGDCQPDTQPTLGGCGCGC